MELLIGWTLLCTLILSTGAADPFEAYKVHGDEARRYITRKDYEQPTRSDYYGYEDDCDGQFCYNGRGCGCVEDDSDDDYLMKTAEDEMDDSLLIAIQKRNKAYVSNPQNKVLDEIVRCVRLYGPIVMKVVKYFF
ncbi:unnamed protein product [Calicophoron daubneyi]|uniref:Secreted protein n=1 Tax=Calicophoron daubneyi TaxID=300641 RepID=A0AAV2T3D0_CALDB